MVWIQNNFSRLAFMVSFSVTVCCLIAGCGESGASAVLSDMDGGFIGYTTSIQDPVSNPGQGYVSRPADLKWDVLTPGLTDTGFKTSCLPSPHGTLAFDADTIDFHVQLIGSEHVMSTSLINKGMAPVTVTEIVLYSDTSYRIVNPPDVPFTLGSCESREVTFKIFNDVVGPHRSHVDVSYVDGQGQTGLISAKLRGAIVTPESITCRWSINELPDSYHTSGKEGKTYLRVGNSGTGVCVVDDWGIADCNVDKNGHVTCPSADEAEKSSMFSASSALDEYDAYRNVGSSFKILVNVHLSDDGKLLEELPHYAVLYLKAHERLTGRVSNFPESTASEEEGARPPWHIVVVD